MVLNFLADGQEYNYHNVSMYLTYDAFNIHKKDGIFSVQISSCRYNNGQFLVVAKDEEAVAFSLDYVEAVEVDPNGAITLRAVNGYKVFLRIPTDTQIPEKVNSVHIPIYRDNPPVTDFYIKDGDPYKVASAIAFIVKEDYGRIVRIT